MDAVSFLATSVRRERERAALTLTELAKRAGVAKSTLSQLESGVGNPSVETVWALSNALNVPFSRLVDPTPVRVEVIRFGEGTTARSEHSDYAATLLSAAPPGTRRDLYLLVAEPGPEKHSEPHLPGTIEHLVITQGRARVGPVGAAVELSPGDYISYSGDEPHVFIALEPRTRALLVSEHR